MVGGGGVYTPKVSSKLQYYFAPLSKSAKQQRIRFKLLCEVHVFCHQPGSLFLPQEIIVSGVVMVFLFGLVLLLGGTLAMYLSHTF